MCLGKHKHVRTNEHSFPRRNKKTVTSAASEILSSSKFRQMINLPAKVCDAPKILTSQSKVVPTNTIDNSRLQNESDFPCLKKMMSYQ